MTIKCVIIAKISIIKDCNTINIIIEMQKNAFLWQKVNNS